MDELEVPQPVSVRRTPKKPTRALPSVPVEAEEQETLAVDVSSTIASDANSPQTVTEATLTPIRAHYLKKTLITLQFRQELAALVNPPSSAPNLSPFSYLGPPFSPPPKSSPPLDLPFTRFMFRNFVLSFPFLAGAPKDFFPSKLQPFITSLLSRNISFTDNPLRDADEETETHAQEKAMQKMEKYFAFLLGSAIKLVEKEEVVRLSQADLKRIETLAQKRRERTQRSRAVFEVNVICVRTVTEKGRMRSRAHEV
jgi:PX-associated